MENLDKKIKLKLQTLVEGLINEAPPTPPGGVVDDLARFVQKFGDDIKRLFGDDIARAAYKNLADDSILLLSRALRNASVRTGREFWLKGGGKFLVKDVIDDIERLAANPSEYDDIVSTYGNLQLADGTYIRNFFKRRPIPPKKSLIKKVVQTTKQLPRTIPKKYKEVKGKIDNNEFVKGWRTKTGVAVGIKAVKIPFQGMAKFLGFRKTEVEKLTFKDFIKFVGWMATGVGDIFQIARNLGRSGVSNKLIYTLMNISGQYAKRIWWWTLRLTIIQFLYDLAKDYNADNILYTDFKTSVWPRIKKAWTLGGYDYVVPWVLVEKELMPILDNIFKGGGAKQALPKTELLEKLSQLNYTYKTALEAVKKDAAKEAQEKLNKVDSLAKVNNINRNKIDSLLKTDPSQVANTDSLFNTLYPADTTKVKTQQQPQQPQPQQQRTDNVVPPKFVDPFKKK